MLGGLDPPPNLIQNRSGKGEMKMNFIK